MRDMYGYIDGGYDPGNSYQFCCTSQPWKGTALVFHMIPEMKNVWYDQTFFDYTDRWVNFGVWTQPDPCAPVDQGGGHDTETDFCILDPDLEYFNSPSDFACQAGQECGRFPEPHNTNADDGGRLSRFQRSMWNAYRGPSCYDGICEDTMAFVRREKPVILTVGNVYLRQKYVETGLMRIVMEWMRCAVEMVHVQHLKTAQHV